MAGPRRARAGLLLCALALHGCGAEELRGAQTVRTLVYDPDRATFLLADRTLHTLHELTTLSGATTEFRSGARLSVDARAAASMDTCEDFSASFVRDAGRRPSLSFIDDGGVWVPEDFDGLMMVSTYYNFELSRDFFLAAGVSPEALDGTTTFYEPTFLAYDEAGALSGAFGNAAFVPCIASFLVFAGADLRDIPLGANPGVAAHEYGHLVFDRVLYGVDGGASPPPEHADAELLLLALDEGLADFFGAAVLGDPNFATRSLTYGRSPARNLAPGSVWSMAAEDALLVDGGADPYPLATVWGSFFWDLALALDGGASASAALALRSLERLRGDAVARFSTAAMLNATVAAAEEVDDGGLTLALTCAAVSDRFAQLHLVSNLCPP